jgi:hypothetical protein
MVQLVLMVKMVLQENLVIQDHQVLKAHKESKEMMDRMVFKECQVIRVQKDVLVT